MPPGEKREPADEAINEFIRHLANRDFSITTRRIRRHFLDEYLQHVQQAAGTVDISVSQLMEPARAAAWLADAADGKTRTRNTLGGPDAAAYSNSMRVRIDSYNAFAEFLCLPGRYDRQPPAAGDYRPRPTPNACFTTWPSAGPSTPTPPRRSALPPWPRSWPIPAGTYPNSPGSTSAPCTWTARHASISPTAPAVWATRPCRS